MEELVVGGGGGAEGVRGGRKPRLRFCPRSRGAPGGAEGEAAARDPGRPLPASSEEEDEVPSSSASEDEDEEPKISLRPLPLGRRRTGRIGRPRGTLPPAREDREEPEAEERGTLPSPGVGARSPEAAGKLEAGQFSWGEDSGGRPPPWPEDLGEQEA